MEIVLTILIVFILAAVTVGFVWIMSNIYDAIWAIPEILKELVKIRELLEK